VAAEVSGVEVKGGGSASAESEDPGPAKSKQSNLAADSDPGVARSGLETVGHRGGGGHLPAGSTPGGLALPGTGAESSAERRPASQARQAARPAATGRDRSDGLWSTTGRSFAVDHCADCARSEATRNGRHGGTRNHPPLIREPRAKAVAGKKCGACPSWTRNTSSGWRRC